MFRHYIFILMFTVFSGSCHVQVQYPSEFPSKTIITTEEDYWFWGFLGEKVYEIYEFCPHGRVYEILIQSTFLQSSLTVLTLGIYSPRTITIVCSIRDD